MAFPAGKGQHQLTFPSYHSASVSNNNLAQPTGAYHAVVTLVQDCSHEDLCRQGKAARDGCVVLEHFNKARTAKVNSGNNTGRQVGHHI